MRKDTRGDSVPNGVAHDGENEMNLDDNVIQKSGREKKEGEEVVEKRKKKNSNISEEEVAEQESDNKKDPLSAPLSGEISPPKRKKSKQAGAEKFEKNGEMYQDAKTPKISAFFQAGGKRKKVKEVQRDEMEDSPDHGASPSRPSTAKSGSDGSNPFKVRVQESPMPKNKRRKAIDLDGNEKEKELVNGPLLSRQSSFSVTARQTIA